VEDRSISPGTQRGSVQIVGYETADPELLLAEDGRVERVPLDPGVELEYTLRERHCAGVVDAEGAHAACDHAAAPYCPEHTSTWPCARCTGNCDLPLPSCREEHAVYLAVFAPDTFKVGVTRLWRLERRLREQGADRGAHIRTVENGRRARVVEATIAADGPTDRVRVATKAAGLHQSVDEAAWATLVDAYDPLGTAQFDYGLGLEAQPVTETLATGTVRGTKGRLLVLESGGTAYAVDMRDLVGYEVDSVPSARNLQSSLGAFGE
jgi:hypothetical protein